MVYIMHRKNYNCWILTYTSYNLLPISTCFAKRKVPTHFPWELGHPQSMSPHFPNHRSSYLLQSSHKVPTSLTYNLGFPPPSGKPMTSALISYVMMLWKSDDIWVTHESYVCVLRRPDIQHLSLVSHLVSFDCIVIEGQSHMFYMFATCLYFYQIFWHMSHILSHMFCRICLICFVICVICLSYVSQKIAIFWKIFEFSNCTFRAISYVFVICHIFF